MRINSHAHIFTFRSVFTEKTLDILIRRLSREGWPDFLIEAAEATLRKAVKVEYFDEQTLVSELVGKLNASDKLKTWLGTVSGDIPGDVHVLAYGKVDGILKDAGLALLQKLGTLLSRNEDAGTENIDDLVAFLLLGIKHAILDVAAELITLSGSDAIVTALMMDITDGSGTDEAQFSAQLNDTSQAALAYPGRILPFVAVNTLRATHYDHMVEGLEKKGFVGVKLYPSLGYPVDAAEMEPVYLYCEAHDVPILLHCNQGGFYANKASVRYCDPKYWEPVLEKHPGLRVCFGHFGGDENLAKLPMETDSWTTTILSLMDRYDGVYADISYHTAPMDGGTAQTSYFANLGALLDTEKYRDRIVFGSDFLLVRQRVREDNLWRYFESHFLPEDWERITRANPAQFLGLTGGAGPGLSSLGGEPNKAGGPRPNIIEHLNWLRGNATVIGELPAGWVTELIEKQIADGVKWYPNPFGTRWTKNNQAHLYTAIWLNGNLRPDRTANGDFIQVGGRLVRDLKDFPVESRPAAERAAKIRGLADDLYIFLCTARPQGGGASLEANVAQADAKDALAKLFGDGDLQLFHFGPVVDSVLQFAGETALS